MLSFPVKNLDDPALWKPSPTPGKVTKLEYHTHWYSGMTATPFKKPICVYTPYGYDPENGKYDLLVLLPGMDMPASCYLSRAHRYSRELYSVQFQNVIDTLIDTGAVKPMVIVTMPYYGATVEGHPNMELDQKQVAFELAFDLLPFMEKNYSLAEGREHRGLFGFSYTASMMVKHLMAECITAFGWYGLSSIFSYNFSDGLTELKEFQKYHPLHYVYVGCGDKDDAHSQTLDAYGKLSPVLTCSSCCVVLPDTGHDARTYDTAITNCLLRFFKE